MNAKKRNVLMMESAKGFGILAMMFVFCVCGVNGLVPEDSNASNDSLGNITFCVSPHFLRVENIGEGNRTNTITVEIYSESAIYQGGISDPRFLNHEAVALFTIHVENGTICAEGKEPFVTGVKYPFGTGLARNIDCVFERYDGYFEVDQEKRIIEFVFTKYLSEKDHADNENDMIEISVGTDSEVGLGTN